MPVERITEFNGVSRQYPRTRLPLDKFFIDEGGDHYEDGVWKLRRGQRHTSLPKLGCAIQTILGWELPGVGYSTLVICDDGTAEGELNVEEQAGAETEGFGVGGFGEEDFGD